MSKKLKLSSVIAVIGLSLGLASMTVNAQPTEGQSAYRLVADKSSLNDTLSSVNKATSSANQVTSSANRATSQAKSVQNKADKATDTDKMSRDAQNKAAKSVGVPNSSLNKLKSATQ